MPLSRSDITTGGGTERRVGTKPTIRPVRVDESGRIFEINGEQIVMPGLEPEAILESFEDERVGRMRSLKDIFASRNQHGIMRSGSTPGQNGNGISFRSGLKRSWNHASPNWPDHPPL
jgi:hypothetical protein